MAEFEETQQLWQWWLWGLLLVLGAGWGVLLWQQLGRGHPVGTRPLSTAGLWLAGGLLVALIAWFYTLTLTTQVRPDGLWVRYAPLGDVHVRWEELARAEAVRYGFVGYGIRFFRRLRHGLQRPGEPGPAAVQKERGKAAHRYPAARCLRPGRGHVFARPAHAR